MLCDTAPKRNCAAPAMTCVFETCTPRTGTRVSRHRNGAGTWMILRFAPTCASTSTISCGAKFSSWSTPPGGAGHQRFSKGGWIESGSEGSHGSCPREHAGSSLDFDTSVDSWSSPPMAHRGSSTPAKEFPEREWFVDRCGQSATRCADRRGSLSITSTRRRSPSENDSWCAFAARCVDSIHTRRLARSNESPDVAHPRTTRTQVVGV